MFVSKLFLLLLCGFDFLLKNLKQNLCFQNKKGKNVRSTSLYINSLLPVKNFFAGKNWPLGVA